jgi:DNA-binding response OmpR family regulator
MAVDADKTEKILVVEDEPDLRSLIRQRLEEEKYMVIEAENGDMGLKKARAEQPALILLDIRMPESTGYEMLKALRQSGNWGANVPVIFLSNIEPQSDDEIEDLMAL